MRNGAFAGDVVDGRRCREDTGRTLAAPHHMTGTGTHLHRPPVIEVSIGLSAGAAQRGVTQGGLGRVAVGGRGASACTGAANDLLGELRVRLRPGPAARRWT